MENILHIGGVSAAELAAAFGTPLLVYDEEMLRKRLREYRECMTNKKFSTRVAYAGKTFLCKAMAKLVREEGASLDVVSGGELHCALAAGFPAKDIVFHGNNKTPDELRAALEAGVGTIVVDNLPECEALAALTRQTGTQTDVLLRVNPGVEAHTHKYIITAHPDSKFGVSVTRRDELYAVLETMRASGTLHFRGFHAHIGSQIFDKAAFAAEIEALAALAQETQQRGWPAEVFDLGGGFAARYTDEDAPIPVPEVCKTILETCARQTEERHLALREVWIEPGRSVAGEAGTTLYTAGWQKTTDHRQYVFVDGGMADNIRPALYEAQYSCDAATRMNEAKTQTYTVAGKCCESGDILIESALLPPLETGDLLAVYTTGAYCYSMASNYNHLGRPAVVFARGGKARCVLRRETPQDLLYLETEE